MDSNQLILQYPTYKQLCIIVTSTYDINSYLSQGWLVKYITSESKTTYVILEKWE